MVANDIGTLALTASSYSISAVTCLSPLPKSIQPSAMRCRVGRKPTSRSMVLTSCQGQPVRADHEAALATSSEFAVVKPTLCGSGMGTPEPLVTSNPTIVAFVTSAAGVDNMHPMSTQWDNHGTSEYWWFSTSLDTIHSADWNSFKNWRIVLARLITPHVSAVA
jgi:hypothetical protein